MVHVITQLANANALGCGQGHNAMLVHAQILLSKSAVATGSAPVRAYAAAHQDGFEKTALSINAIKTATPAFA
jgi:hypothetical protein